MKKLKVIKIDNYLYTLEDEDKNIYVINIEFIDTDINIGDYLYISNEVLEENNLYTYGPIEKESDIKDLVKVIKKDKDEYLQRYYG